MLPWLQLEAVTRIGLTEWNVTVVMPSVTFAPLITPSSETPDKLTTIEISENYIIVVKYSNKYQVVCNCGICSKIVTFTGP